MGLDLTLMPVGNITEGGSQEFAHTRMRCLERRKLFDAILELEAQAGKSVADTFNALTDQGYSNTQESRYGDPLKTLTAGELMQFSADKGVIDNDINRAVWLYLSAINPKARVALYWE